MDTAANDPSYQLPKPRNSLEWLARLYGVLEDTKPEIAQCEGLHHLYNPATTAMMERAFRSAHANIPGLGVMGVKIGLEFHVPEQWIKVRIFESYDHVLAPENKVPPESQQVMQVLVRKSTAEEVQRGREDQGQCLLEAQERFKWYMKAVGARDTVYPSPHVYVFANLLNDSKLYSLRLIHSAVSAPSSELGPDQTYRFQAVSALRFVEVEFNAALTERRFMPFFERSMRKAAEGMRPKPSAS